MGITKRTFTFPDEVSQELDAMIPSRERSKFMTSLVQEALRAKKREELLSLLDTFPRKKHPDGRLSEDVLREIREGRAHQLLDNIQP